MANEYWSEDPAVSRIMEDNANFFEELAIAEVITSVSVAAEHDRQAGFVFRPL
jgi:hypothetical protein